MTDNIYAWHFVGDTLRDGRPVPPDGEWLEHDGALVLCASGLHYSRRVIDALRYAPGNTICYVEIGGEWLDDDDKGCAERRRIIWRIDGEAVLHAFARWCALQVIDLWDPPDVVREYLDTGNEDLRDAAWDAARDAAGAAAGDAAGAAAWAAAWDAAWDAARDAAGAAAGDAAGAAAGDAQNEQLEAMIHEARDGRTEWVFSGEAAIPAGRDTCPIHDFEQPCPSCAMVAIDAGIDTTEIEP